MSPLFLDTGYFIALFNAGDPYHTRARRWMATLNRVARRQVTTTAILLEAGDGFGHRQRWHQARAFMVAVCLDPAITVVAVDCAMLNRARLLKEARSDKDWGDCISFTVMSDHGITEALAADRHFVQAGFRALLLDS